MSIKPWLLAAGVISAIVLLLQAAKNSRASYDLLAHSANLEYLEVPLVKALAGALEKLDPKPGTTGGWIAGIIVALEDLGFYDEAHSTLDEAARLDHVEDRAAVLEYLQKQSSDSAREFENRVEMRQLNRTLALET